MVHALSPAHPQGRPQFLWNSTVRSPAEEVQLVLASGSETRARMLANAGIAFLQDAADLDEPVSAQRIEASGFSIENDFAHG